jgi:hypothetical protein
MEVIQVKSKYRAATKDLTHLAGQMRQRNNNALSTIYTQVEATLGDTKQAQALKDLIKWEVWRMTDNNQDTMYDLFAGKFDTIAPVQTPENQ